MIQTLSPVAIVFIGFVPSLIWLGFFYKKDCHPEPKFLLTRVLFMGIILAPLAVIGQWLFREVVLYFYPAYQISVSSWFFLWAAFVEEIVKFWAVKFVVLHNPEFDEPIDAMIYMVAAALGFAAIENILAVYQAAQQGIQAAFQLLLLRFAGATLLHAVSSAVLGYFVALSYIYHQRKGKLLIAGIATATFFHFIFNYLLLVGNEQQSGFLLSAGALIFMAVLIFILLGELRKKTINIVELK